MEAVCSSETSVNFCRTTQCHNTEDSTFHSHCCDNLKFMLVFFTKKVVDIKIFTFGFYA
jgi:hypothetical protein